MIKTTGRLGYDYIGCNVHGLWAFMQTVGSMIVFRDGLAGIVMSLGDFLSVSRGWRFVFLLNLALTITSHRCRRRIRIKEPFKPHGYPPPRTLIP
jgi:hypothetical protein